MDENKCKHTESPATQGIHGMEGAHRFSQQDASLFFEMLESSHLETIQNIKELVHENFNSTKDAWLIHALLDYYIGVQSIHALDILTHVREPHDKHMFDRMVEYLKNESTRYHCLLLLSHLVYRQPSWLFKITQHRIFPVLLNLLKTEVDFPCLMCALFAIISLLPMFPSQIGSYLSDIFEIFSRLVAWCPKKSIGVPDVYLLHLQVGVYALFHRLYGMYPCNFLSYLRSHYGGKEYREENMRVFISTIRPMLEKVKLHPLLVTACKDSEISQKRWKKMATHDIMALCASISLDAIEGTPEDIHYTNGGSVFASQATQSQESSMQYFRSISSTISTNTECDPNAKTYDTWTPSRVCSFSTPSPELLLNSLEENLQRSQSSASRGDIIENFNSEDHCVVIDQENIENVPIDEKTFMPIAEAIEATEEELIDKEVCELTSMDPVPNDYASSRYGTPFRSTTQNLTDQAEFTVSSARNSAEAREEDVDKENQFGIEEISDLKMTNFVHTINRLRYFSQCGPPPEISRDFPLWYIPRRSISCPHINMSEVNVPMNSSTADASGKKDEKPKPNTQRNSNASTLWTDDSVTGQPMLKMPKTPYDHLIPMALQPCSLRNKAFVSDSCLQHTYKNPEYLPFYCTLSPAEILDRHLQMGSEAHLIQLSSVPLTSTENTDWTHFGGNPPVDEVSMSRTQVQLLHNQVMFERHRREIHAERNRRFLGKVKRAHIQEENIAALEDQVLILQKEIEQIKNDMEIKADLFNHLEEIRNHKEKELSTAIEKQMQENTNLQYSNKKLQGLLVSQKNENDVLKSELLCCQSKILNMNFQVELASAELEQSRKIEKKMLWLSKENLLLREINQQYEERSHVSREQHLPDFASELMDEALHSDLKNAKQALDSKIALVDALHGKIANLEDEQVASKSKLSEQSKVIELMKDLHRDEILVREERLADLRKINLHQSTHILKLYHELEIAKYNADIIACDEEGQVENIPAAIDSNDVPNFTLDAELESLCSSFSAVINEYDDNFEKNCDRTNSTSAFGSDTPPNGL